MARTRRIGGPPGRPSDQATDHLVDSATDPATDPAADFMIGEAPGDPSPRDLGRQLRELRRSQGMSRYHAARSAGLTRRELAAYERGRDPVPLGDLASMAGAFGVDVATLLGERDALHVSTDGTSLRMGEHHRELDAPVAPEALLSEYLSMVEEARAPSPSDPPPGSPPALRSADLSTLAAVLGGRPEAVERRIAALARQLATASEPYLPIDEPVAAGDELTVMALDDQVVSWSAEPDEDGWRQVREWDFAAVAGVEPVPNRPGREPGLCLPRADARSLLAPTRFTSHLVADPSAGVAIETTLDFVAGAGFGIVFRAQRDRDGRLDGYSFEVDPVAGDAYLLRRWDRGRQHWRPLASAPASSLESLFGEHHFRVAVLGPQFEIAIDEVTVLALDDVDRADPTDGSLPRGHRVGIHAWTTTELRVVDFRVQALT